MDFAIQSLKTLLNIQEVNNLKLVCKRFNQCMQTYFKSIYRRGTVRNDCLICNE